MLACEGPNIDWFESVVVDAKPDDLFVLRFDPAVTCRVPNIMLADAD